MSKLFSTSFSVGTSSISLNQGDKILFKFSSSVSTNDFTASLSQGSLLIYSTAVSTGYVSTSQPYFDSSSIATGSNSNEIIFSQGVSSFYNEGYVFSPNPLSGSVSSSLYSTYGDVDYDFTPKIFDIIVIYLSDGTYIESRILNVYKGAGNLLRLTLDITLSNFVKSNLTNNTYRRFLLLTRKDDETNAYLYFSKRPGQTSYGFIIPENISSDILNNIDTITKQVKQKLLADQQGTV